jgi:hypothetical protein
LLDDMGIFDNDVFYGESFTFALLGLS